MKSILKMALICFLIINLVGCEAFVRKFTRKSKKEKEPEELVLAPEEYKPPVRTPEEIYRGYFLFWQSWHDELINALSQEGSRKKRIDCANEALKNLANMREMLDAQTQKKLDKYISQFKDLREMVQKDLYVSNSARYLHSAERIKLSIVKDFTYQKVKNNFK